MKSPLSPSCRAKRAARISSGVALGVASCVLTLGACRAPSKEVVETAGRRAPRVEGHTGPAVDPKPTGPARFVEPLLGAFDVDAAMAIATYADGFYRAPAGEGYELTIDRVLADLYGAGYGDQDGFALDVHASGMPQPAWTPRSAKIVAVAGPEIVARAGKNRDRILEQTILEFDSPEDVARVMLPRGAPSCDLQGIVVFSLDDVVEGSILATDRSVRSVEVEAAEKGAAAIVSHFLLPYCVDPSGDEVHFDAIFEGTVRPGATLPSFYVSPRTAQSMEVGTGVGTRYRLVAEVEEEVTELRTVVATIRGSVRPDEYVAVLAHADGAGANDNAAGVGGVVELARAMKSLIDSGALPAPRRSIKFVFGQESGSGSVVLDEVDGTPVAAIVADMIGASYDRTGAVCLLERGWDPGALVTLPPDAHTPWGAGEVVEEDVVPNGLSIVLREALIDVGGATRAKGAPAWPTREHPWEGGSDHDAFLAQGVAAALVWHFTDFAYQTSLDRIEHIDPLELKRTTLAIGAAALAVADATPTDLERHLDSLNQERRMRLDAVQVAGAGVGMEELWKDWFDGARFWLRALTAGEDLPEGEGLRSLDSFGGEEASDTDAETGGDDG
ncbi:MAG: M28 family peptidase [Planctomycetota bacterium]